MRRSFCGSHRERVNAAVELQASRRRRRISLELEEFERPGGRALVEDSPEVEAYLAALSVAERPRRASLDCSWGGYERDIGSQHGVPNVPLEEQEEREEDEEVDSKLGEIKREPDTVDDMQIGGSVTQVLHAQSFNEGSRSTPKKVMSSARRACSSFMKKLSNSGAGSRPRSSRSQASQMAAEARASSKALTPSPFGVNAPLAVNLAQNVPHVKISDTWAGEGKLNEWVDWSVVNSALRPPDLMQAQASLISASRGTGQLVVASAGSSKS